MIESATSGLKSRVSRSSHFPSPKLKQPSPSRLSRYPTLIHFRTGLLAKKLPFRRGILELLPKLPKYLPYIDPHSLDFHLYLQSQPDHGITDYHRYGPIRDELN
jgi:hypothetical protein